MRFSALTVGQWIERFRQFPNKPDEHHVLPSRRARKGAGARCQGTQPPNPAILKENSPPPVEHIRQTHADMETRHLPWRCLQH